MPCRPCRAGFGDRVKAAHLAAVRASSEATNAAGCAGYVRTAEQPTPRAVPATCGQRSNQCQPAVPRGGRVKAAHLAAVRADSGATNAAGRAGPAGPAVVPSALPMQRSQVLFLVKFFAILIGAYLLIAWSPVNDNVIVPFTTAIASWSGALLNAIGEKVTTTGTMITSPKFGVNINNGCNGVEAMLILLASIVAFPASVKSRAFGLFLGAICVQLLNSVRIVSLYLLGAYHPRLFDIFHTAVWQIVIILSAIGFFLLWSARVGPSRLANNA